MQWTSHFGFPRLVICLAAIAVAFSWPSSPATAQQELSVAVERLMEQIGVQRGVCAVLGLNGQDQAAVMAEAARAGDLMIYFQSPEATEVAAVRQAGAANGALGRRLFADVGDFGHVHLADNLAGTVLVSEAATAVVSDQELLRVLHPRGIAKLGERRIVKPFPANTDNWSHPYHGPDNNPQSTDQQARAPYLTQFLADPKFCPMPEVSVAAGGRVFRAFGHIAHKANQNAMLNTLICVNAYNGAILWTRPLSEGFMIHRNTMIATQDHLYLADDVSCKVIDAATGEVTDEITLPEGVAEGPVWKWMALVDGTLYALVGNEETPIKTQPSRTAGLGHWPWGMWDGHDYNDPKKSFGFARTLVAIDPVSKKLRWSHREPEHLDARGICMQGNRLYCFAPEKYLGCIDGSTGEVIWKNSNAEVLAAIGPNQKAQHYVTGYATTAYIKANDEYLFFAGPQRAKLVVLRAKDGQVAWARDHGNFQLVLREDGLYAAGPQLPGQPPQQYTGAVLDYSSGEILAQLPMRRACTRATGTVDSVFFRASGGTTRIDTATKQAKHIAPMRPPCQDGVIISDGNLYWGPWMCGCQLSLYGHICLTGAGDFDFRPGVDASRLILAENADDVQPLEIQAGDWPTYQGDNGRNARSTIDIGGKLQQQWSVNLPGEAFPTAPVTAGDLVFYADRSGVVHAVSAVDGSPRWQASTGGSIFVSPTVADGRLFVGSADGRVYAYEAVSGRLLWTFRAAPADRWIPVYGNLISTWPVAGGVVVQDGVVYAAAGIAHYDGTHVFALDAATGKVKWYNDESGSTSEKVEHGVSLQGELSIRDGELRFVGGGVHEEARFDLASGHCLNEATDWPNSSFHTAFYGYFPDYGKYVSLDCTLDDGCTVCYDATYEGSWHSPLALLPALDPGQRRDIKPVSRWGGQWRRPRDTKTVWNLADQRRYNGFVVTADTLLAAGHTGEVGTESTVLTAIRMTDGEQIWSQSLPGPVVKGGLAVNASGQVFLALEDGQILAFSAAD